MYDWELFKEVCREDPIFVVLLLSLAGSVLYLFLFGSGF